MSYTYKKKICPMCHHEIGINNYTRHCKVCDGTYNPSKKAITYRVDHDGLNCKFCNKLCKNSNSLTQHELRCSKNPKKLKNTFTDYIVSNRKGKNKYNCPEIAKQCETMKKKYEDGYVSPTKDVKRKENYVHLVHNNEEISKWLNYIDLLSVTIPNYKISNKNRQHYNIVSGMQSIEGNTVKLVFEHDFIANIYLDGKLQHTNTVHHIDKNIKNNDIHNLMVFETNQDHKRFHNSDFAYLEYDEATHLFRCEIRK